MRPEQAFDIISAEVPEGGPVRYQDVYDRLQATEQGRIALQQVHALRRSAQVPLHFKLDRASHDLYVSRTEFPEGWTAGQ